MENYKVGLAGYGYWAPNLARIITNHPETGLVAVCEVDNQKIRELQKRSPGVFVTPSADEFFSRDIDMVVIALPTATHADFLARAIKRNVHILCEKPLTHDLSTALRIAEIATGFSKTLMVGQVFEFHPAVRFMKRRLQDSDTGDVLYIQCQRSGLGPVRKDVDVAVDLASHDISILHYLLGVLPVWVCAHGTAFINKEVNDISFITLGFENGVKAQISVSWIDPVKQRSVKVVCSKEMMYFDDVNHHEKLKIHKMGKDYQTTSGDFGKFQLAIKDGDIFVPSILNAEPLAEEFNHFVSCVQSHTKPQTDIENAMRVMRVLEAIRQSLDSGGVKIVIS